MVKYTVFVDYIDKDGWGECTSMHKSPHRLAAEVVALGVEVDVPEKPFRDGWLVSGWANPRKREFSWRMKRDPGYRVPISEFLSSIPAEARVEARAGRATDAVLADFFGLLDMAVQEGRGINPHGEAARAGLRYLIAKGWMTKEQADALTDAAND